jgi:hypothetical protein
LTILPGWFWKEVAGLWVKKFKDDLAEGRGHKEGTESRRVPYKKFEWSVFYKKFKDGRFDRDEVVKHHDFRGLYTEAEIRKIGDANDKLLAKYEFSSREDVSNNDLEDDPQWKELLENYVKSEMDSKDYDGFRRSCVQIWDDQKIKKAKSRVQDLKQLLDIFTQLDELHRLKIPNRRETEEQLEAARTSQTRTQGRIAVEEDMNRIWSPYWVRPKARSSI